jgi:hypothetical protein
MLVLDDGALGLAQRRSLQQKVADEGGPVGQPQDQETVYVDKGITPARMELRSLLTDAHDPLRATPDIQYVRETQRACTPGGSP